MESARKSRKSPKITFFHATYSSRFHQKAAKNFKKIKKVIFLDFFTHFLTIFTRVFRFSKKRKMRLRVYGDARKQSFCKNPWFSWAHTLLDSFFIFLIIFYVFIFLKQYCFNKNIEIVFFFPFFAVFCWIASCRQGDFVIWKLLETLINAKCP